MLLTFFCTGRTDNLTGPADLLTESAIQAHHLYRSFADGGTFPIKLYAMTKMSHLFFMQAGRCTLIAYHHAFPARFYAVLKF